jgi:hypothetical protein
LQAEVLFVLYTLLGGPLKGDMQLALARCGIVRALEHMFDRLKFGEPSSLADECYSVCSTFPV